MRILVCSDIHANLTALDAVLTDAGDVQAVWCLGDVVGYGPEPNECIERLRSLPRLECILGNHDAAVLASIDSDSFNPEARFSIQWTQSQLSPAGLRFLEGLPEKVVLGQATLSHGSPRQPVWEYLLDTYSAARSFDFFDTEYCFVGHTHLPVYFQLNGRRQNARLVVPEANGRLTLEPRAILNPGSVGQPRDRDPRAAYAIFDDELHTWEFCRVTYDVARVQTRMRHAGLPERHILRLTAGW